MISNSGAKIRRSGKGLRMGRQNACCTVTQGGGAVFKGLRGRETEIQHQGQV